MIVSVEDNKYTVVVDHSSGIAQVLRYGTVWKDITGDKFTLALCDEILELRERLEALSNEGDK